MTRMAVGRTTHLSQEEIVETALVLLDEGDGEFSMRALAARLKVSPAALYHHFERQNDLVAAVVARVWDEAVTEFLAAVSEPFSGNADPLEVLVVGAICARRAFGRHPRVAPYIALPPRGGEARLAGALAVFGFMMERLGIEGHLAGDAMYAYSNYVIGSLLFSAQRQLVIEQLDVRPAPQGYSSSASRPEDAPVPSAETIAAIDQVVATEGSEAEEAMFVSGLHALLRGLMSPADTGRPNGR
jgi:AcrR family transcriptional regulator